ncbi:MAG: FecR protein [Verrucomicrobiota bacterium]
MNENFFSQMRETAGGLMLDPVVSEHFATVVGLGLLFGLFAYRKMAESLGATNWTLPMAALSYGLGLAAMVAGLTAADIFLLSQVPKDVPAPAYVGGVLVVVLLVVATPIGKLMMKCGYAATASAWVTALMIWAAVIVLADLGFTHFGPKMIRVMDLKGTVSYRVAKGIPQEEIKRRRVGLPIGVEITTKADASTTIDLGGDSYLAIRPLSVVRIVALGEVVTVEVDLGRVLGSVRHSAQTKVQFRTPAATTTIVGTDFLVESDSQKQTFVTVAAGKVQVASSKTGATVEVGAGQTVNCANGGAPTPVRKADPADLKVITSFKTAVGEAMSQRNKQIEDAL